MKIVIVGSGYVGLVAGVCFAKYGHTVVCVDKDKSKIKDLKRGIVPIYEPGLTDLMHAQVKLRRLSFTTDLKAALIDTQAVFIAVGTPPRIIDGHADMRFVHEVAKAIAANASGDLVVVNKSTVPVGTGDDVERILRLANNNFHFSVVSNPEFLREGAAIQDFLQPDRIVIGAEDEWAKTIVADIYGVEGFKDATVVFTSRRSAELIKYAANAFLAMKITFINEISDLCEVVDANVRDVAHAVGLDNRIGTKFLNVGPGYGGSCFPKDTMALAKTARDYRVELRTVETVIQVNENRKRAMALKVLDACDGTVRGKKIAILGLAFKANTDDMRDAPSISIIQALQDFGAQIFAYDPESMENSIALLLGINFCKSAYDAIENADAIVIVTEWDEFRSLDLKQIQTLSKTPNVVDLRNIYDANEMKAAGIKYQGIGNLSKEKFNLATTVTAE